MTPKPRLLTTRPGSSETPRAFLHPLFPEFRGHPSRSRSGTPPFVSLRVPSWFPRGAIRKGLIRVDPCRSVVAPPRSDSGVPHAFPSQPHEAQPIPHPYPRYLRNPRSKTRSPSETPSAVGSSHDPRRAAAATPIPFVPPRGAIQERLPSCLFVSLRGSPAEPFGRASSVLIRVDPWLPPRGAIRPHLTPAPPIPNGFRLRRSRDDLSVSRFLG
jgi:hypothetical protein